MAKAPPKKLRLDVISPAPSGSKEGTELAAEMAATVAHFEAAMSEDPGRPIALEEIGLSQAEVDLLLGEGLSLPVLRAIGRRLRAANRTRDIETYRRLLAIARARGLADPIDAIELDRVLPVE